MRRHAAAFQNTLAFSLYLVEYIGPIALDRAAFDLEGRPVQSRGCADDGRQRSRKSRPNGREIGGNLMFQQALDTISKQVLIRPLRQFHRRQVGRSRRGPVFRQSEPDHRRQALRDRALHAPPTSSSRSTPRTRPRTPGARPRPPSARASSTRSPTAWRRISTCSRWSRRSTTASRSARRPTPTCRCAIDHFRYFAGVIRAQEGAHLRDRPRHRRLSFP